MIQLPDLSEKMDIMIRELEDLADDYKAFGKEVLVRIDGYWLDDKKEFHGLLCRLTQEVHPTRDDEIHYYFNGVRELRSLMDIENAEDKVITDFVLVIN